MQRSALVRYSAEQMYALVNDVDAYSQFLPWCRSSRVLESSDGHMRAEIEMSLAGLSRRFSTLNTLTPHESIQIRLLDGPFRHLEGMWRFRALGEDGCKVDVDLEFQVSSGLFDVALAPAFERVCNTLVESFVQRADEVYGRRG